MIHISVHLYGALRDHLPPNGKGAVSLPLGASIQDLLVELSLVTRPSGIPVRPIIIAVNDDSDVPLDFHLKDGDRVTIAGAITGG